MSEVGVSHEQQLTCRTDKYLLSFITFEHNMNSYCIDPHMYGFYTKRAFHRVYERIKRTSDEKVMVVRSWHSRAHSLLSSARRAQPKEVSSARRAQICPKRSAHPRELGQKRSALPQEVSSAGRAQLCPQEVSSARRAHLCPKRSAHPKRAWPEEVSSTSRGQLSQKSSALPQEVSSARRARPQLILSDPSE